MRAVHYHAFACVLVMFTIIGAMAESESSLISERVKVGMAAARARVKGLGMRAEQPQAS